jgi:hypothetical protein
MQRRTRLLSLPLVVVASLAASACSGGSDDSAGRTGSSVQTSTPAPTTTPTAAASSSTTSTTAAPTSTAASSDADVLAAVRSFWDLFIEVGGRSGPFDPHAVRARLVTRTTGDELATLFQFFQGNAAAGYVVRGEIDLAPSVVSNDGTTTQVRDCHDDRTGVYRASDGSRIDTDDPARHQVLMTLRQEDGTWKVAAIIDEGNGCVAS